MHRTSLFTGSRYRYAGAARDRFLSIHAVYNSKETQLGGASLPAAAALLAHRCTWGRIILTTKKGLFVCRDGMGRDGKGWGCTCGHTTDRGGEREGTFPTPSALPTSHSRSSEPEPQPPTNLNTSQCHPAWVGPPTQSSRGSTGE